LDATGKSAQLKTIAESSESAIVISLELKNRKLYNLDHMGKMTKESPCDVVEPIILQNPPSYEIKPIETFNAVGNVVEMILNGKGLDGKPKHYQTVIVDGISDFPRWAEKLVIQKLQEKWDNKPAKDRDGSRPVVIGEKNKAAWGVRNNLACLPLERLAAWAEVTGANVFLSTLMTPEYINDKKAGYKVDIQDRIRDKTCDIRVKLIHDGRGYLAKFEKVPNWADEGKDEVVIGKGMMFAEFSKRGMIK
jgi:hypothetical protein